MKCFRHAVLFCSILGVSANALPEFSVTLDLPLLAVSGGVGVYGSYKLSQMNVPEEMPGKQELLPWDRPFAGTSSKPFDLASDVMLVGLASPLVIVGTAFYGNEIGKGEFWGVLAMYGEALALQSGINLMVRSMEVWPRPLLYGECENSVKEKGEAYGSFYSGHVSAMFTSAVFTSYLFDSLYPSSRYFWPVTIGSFAVAGTSGAMRVAAGKHYPTDVVVAAFAGTIVSVAVIATHEILNGRVSLFASAGYAGATIYF